MSLRNLPFEMWPIVLGVYSELKYRTPDVAESELMRRAMSQVHSDQLASTNSLLFRLGIDRASTKGL